MKMFCHTCGEVRDIPWPKEPGEPRPTCETCGSGLFTPPRQPRDGARGRRRTSLSTRQPERIWDLARAKCEEEMACRFCGKRLNAEHLAACHIVGRERDAFDPLTREPREQPWVVEADRIVPGCAGCHTAYDHHELDLLGKLTLEEELQAVRDCFPPVRGSGIENARVRLAPLAYRTETAGVA